MKSVSDPSSLLSFAKDQRIEVIDLKFANLIGGWHHITLPAERLGESLLTRGVGIDGSSVPGFSVPGFKVSSGSDLVIVPDPSTAQLDPFYERRTLSLVCNICEANGGRFGLDPRAVSIRAESYLKKSQIADRSIWGPEFEFYIFDRVTFSNEENLAFYRVDSREADWARSENEGSNNSYTIAPRSGYHASPPQDSNFLLRDRMCAEIARCGIPVKYHHHEVGGPGQCEIEMLGGGLLECADAAMTIKYICKMVAQRADCCVTFMPKPLYNEAGSGMHFHQQLFLGDTPIFYDGKGYAGLSTLAMHYIGGLLQHGPALLALTSPSTNSYKRLVPGFEAPVKCIFGLGNRSAAVRIPKYADAPDEKRVEFRPPDGTCNMYLAMAAQLMAGLDGIRKKIDPVKLGYGPFDGDVTKLPAIERERLLSLPSSLGQALDALESDPEFLVEGDVFTEDLIVNWIAWKRAREISEVNQRPHPYEMRLYFDS